MPPVNRIGEQLTAVEAMDLNRNKELNKKGFTDSVAKSINGYVTKVNGFYYYKWGKIPVGTSVKRTTDGIAYLDVTQFGNQSGNSAIVKLTTTNATIKTPEPRKIFGMDLNDWMALALSGPIDAEVIGAKGGIEVATVALRSERAIAAARTAGKVSPELADDLEILLIAQAANSKPKSAAEAIADVRASTTMTDEDKINAIGIVRDNSLVSEEGYTKAQEAITEITQTRTKGKQDKIDEAVGNIKNGQQRIDALNNYKKGENVDEETVALVDKMIGDVSIETNESSGANIFIDDSLTFEQQYNKLLELKKTLKDEGLVEEGEDIGYIDSLMQDRLSKITERDNASRVKRNRDRFEAQIESQRDAVKRAKSEYTESLERNETLRKERLIEEQEKEGLLAETKAIEKLANEEVKEDVPQWQSSTRTSKVNPETGTATIDEGTVAQALLQKTANNQGGSITDGFVTGITEAGAGVIDGFTTSGDVVGAGVTAMDIIGNLGINVDIFSGGSGKGGVINNDEELPTDFFDDLAPQVVDVKNINLLIKETLLLSTDAYNKNVVGSKDYYFIDKYDIPVLFNRQVNKLYVAFRGTASLSNALTDISSTSLLDNDTNFLSTYGVFNNRLPSRYSNVKMHSGFLKSLAEMYLTIRYEVDKYDELVTDVIFTGHSLGAAIASMMYYVYNNDVNQKYKNNNTRCVTYGSPRFLFNGYERIYTENCSRLIRVFNKNDIVSYLPFHSDVLGTTGKTALTVINPSVSIGESVLNKFGSGYIHIGRPLCLDGSVKFNSANELVVNIMQGNIRGTTRLIRGKDTLVGNRLIQFILSKDYQLLLLNGTIESVSTQEIKSDISDAMLEYVAQELQGNASLLASTSEKFDLAEPYNLSEILKSRAEGEDPEQADFTMASLVGSALNFNKLSADAHALTTYQNNLDILLDYEISNEVDVLEIQGKDDLFKIDELDEFSQYNLDGSVEEILDEVLNDREEVFGFNKGTSGTRQIGDLFQI
jgi:hypothetical protein